MPGSASASGTWCPVRASEAVVEPSLSHGSRMVAVLPSQSRGTLTDENVARRGTEPMMLRMERCRVGVTEEACSGGEVAHASCDVLVQWGVNRSEHDSVAFKHDRASKVSVEGSEDSGWGPVQSFRSGRGHRVRSGGQPRPELHRVLERTSFANRPREVAVSRRPR